MSLTFPISAAPRRLCARRGILSDLLPFLSLRDLYLPRQNNAKRCFTRKYVARGSSIIPAGHENPKAHLSKFAYNAQREEITLVCRDAVLGCMKFLFLLEAHYYFLFILRKFKLHINKKKKKKTR